MHKNTVLLVIIAALTGLIGGFLLANSLNRAEINALRSQVGPAKAVNSAEPKNDSDATLSNDELRAKIAEADKNPTNFTYQKNLGISLYKYSETTPGQGVLSEALRILTRANELNGKDFDVLVALGNAHFDTGFNKKDIASFETARQIYSKALELNPGDSNVRTDLGISYLVQEPPEYDKAAGELNRVLSTNPQHDRAMQFLVQTYVKQGKLPEADKMLARIIEINPSNPAINDLRSQISAAKNGTNK